MNMFKGYKQADYSPENWAILLDIKAAADTDIDNAASVADVMTVLNNAEAAMAAVHTLLDDAKAAAHASLKAALAGYAQDDYSPENWAVLLNAMATGEPDQSASVEDVAAALNSAQEAMAAVHTLLTDARIAAHTSLETVLAGYTQADYSPEDWTALNGFRTAGDTAIDEAADLTGVEAAQSAAAAGMGAVQTIAQALAAAKSAAHDALAAALEPAAVDLPVIDGDTVNDALTASQEVPATSNSIPDAEEMTAEIEPEPEGSTPDIEQEQ